jgi:hypothetical protein
VLQLCAGEALSGMGLTRLEFGLETLAVGASGLHHISTLTALQDLRMRSDATEKETAVSQAWDLVDNSTASITASMLAPLSRLTCLRLEGDSDLIPYGKLSVNLEPGALLNKPNMRDLRLPDTQLAVVDRPEEPCGAVLLAGLRDMQQLTHLNLRAVLLFHQPGAGLSGLPAAAYTAIAASSQLQHLNISYNEFSLGLWQQLFNPSRQLQQLRVLNIDEVSYDDAWQDFAAMPLTAADVKRLASCCPGLQQL